eukprot:1273756-Rhodomonas_salina.2
MKRHSWDRTWRQYWASHASHVGRQRSLPSALDHADSGKTNVSTGWCTTKTENEGGGVQVIPLDMSRVLVWAEGLTAAQLISVPDGSQRMRRTMGGILQGRTLSGQPGPLCADCRTRIETRTSEWGSQCFPGMKRRVSSVASFGLMASSTWLRHQRQHSRLAERRTRP